MKRCPECNSFFPATEHFCELDGTPLVTVVDNPVSIDTSNTVPQPKSSRSLLPIGALVGILLGLLLFLAYFAMSRQTTQENSNTSSSSSSARQQEVIRPLQSPPRERASPSPEPSAEPLASPSIETPSVQNSSAQVVLSNSDPSTTAGAKGGSDPIVIRLHSGVTIEADQAWQTAEGIWYRKRGVVSLLDPKNVKAIEKVSAVAPQPSVSTSSPSP